MVVIDGGEIVLDNEPKKIFSQVNTLKNLGLDVPQVTELCHILRSEGVDLPDDVITEEECVEKLYELLG